MTASAPAAAGEVAPVRLRRAMGFRDLLLFYLVTGFSVRWISNAAAGGPSAVLIWLLGCAALYVPLMFTVLELSSRYPEEGGCYVWSKRAFTAASALFIGPPEWRGLLENRAYFVGFSLLGLLVALPSGEILNLQGFIQSIATASDRLGLHWVSVVAAALLVAGGLGQAGAWFAASGRLPLVAGIDRFLPPVFGRIHPRYHSPYVSLAVQAAVAAVFIFLGQAGTTVKGGVRPR